ncbi:MAG TPA: xanthine dehydrogenase family protein molybdopterin-binding subunit [Thermoanaerobaculia bacterium]|jgi:isoquinoline 1-oxidoreductase beta subunit|nr:xanthine dehydrogenase family protein molybdopterin-binding subunit [Thermoanaerobaculia bacterium]
MNRRDFLKVSTTASAGLMIGVRFPARAQGPAKANDGRHELGAYVEVGTDDVITIWVPKSDMGQDVRTSLPMIVAEEMDADWSKVKIRQAYLDRKFGRMGTGGSSSVRTMWTPMRQAGATARAMLVGAAAAKLAVPAEELTVEKSVISHAASGKKVTFGEVAEAAASIKVSDVKLKDAKSFRIIGKSAKRLDVPDIVTGKAGYGIDVKVPGMLYASVLRSPVFGGKVASLDATKAKAIAGVKDVVKIDAIETDLSWNGVAVVANSTWAAKKGRDALIVTWDEGPHASESTESLLKEMTEIVDKGTSIVTRGDTAASLASAAKTVEATYDVPYLAHAAMEPLNATAFVKPDGVEMWLSTQSADWAASTAAKWLGYKPEQIKVNVTMLGGGFGRRANPDFALEAVQISKAVGAPVKVQWTREDDMQHDYYRPASHHKISGALDAQNNVVAWHHRIAAPSINAYLSPGSKEGPHESETPGIEDMPYDVPNFRVDFALARSGVPRGWWRSVEHSINGFMTNSFLDELAEAAGRDPVELRLALLPRGFVQKTDRWPYKSDRFRNVIELARDKGDWGKPLPEGRARGFAAHHSFYSYTAQVAEVSMVDGVPRVHRIVCAIDCGIAINPDGIRAQIEGGIVYGLAAALGEKITIDKGRVQQSNFHDFPLLNIAQMPVVEVHIVASDEAPTGTGEPGLPPTAAAVTNAMFRLTGKRVRALPIA